MAETSNEEAALAAAAREHDADPLASTPQEATENDVGTENVPDGRDAGGTSGAGTDETTAQNSGATLFSPLKATATNMSNAGKPYSSFSSGRKWFIVIFSALAGTFSLVWGPADRPISSNIYVPAIPTLADDFQVSKENINVTVTIYLIFQALTPSIWGSAADCYGRRPIYVVCLLIYILACVGTALCPTSDYWLLILMRILQATGGSALIAIGTGVISDIATPQERGKYLGIFNLSSTLGTAIGPLLGGVLAGTLGWRAIFWFLVIACAVVIVPMIFFFPETLRSLVGDGSIPPPLINCTPGALIKRQRELRKAHQQGDLQEDTSGHRSKFKPWASFLLAFQPDLLLIFLHVSLYYSLWYSVLTLFSTLLDTQYGASEIIIGLGYIPNGLGSGISSVIIGRVMDNIYQREKKRVGGDHRHKPEEFRLERVRFEVLPWLMGLSLASSIALGWSIAARANIAVPIIMNLFVGFGTGYLTTVTIYGIDLFPGQGGAVTATFNLIRCLLGAAAVAVVQLINDVMGPGWTFVLLSGICALATPLPFIVLKMGPRWRRNRLARQRQHEEEKKRRESEKHVAVQPPASGSE